MGSERDAAGRPESDSPRAPAFAPHVPAFATPGERLRSERPGVARIIAFAALTALIIGLIAAGREGVESAAPLASNAGESAIASGDELLPDAPKPVPSEVWLPAHPSGIGDIEYIRERPIPELRLVLDPGDKARYERTLAKIGIQNYLLPEDRRWLRARLVEGEREYIVRARLRGDSMTHWSGMIKSWRVRFKSDDLFHGIREINFITPFDRFFCGEALAMHEGRSLGLLTLRDGFARLAFADDPAAVYYMIEHPTPEFLAISGRPETGVFVHRDFIFEAQAAGLPWDMVGGEHEPSSIRNQLKATARDGVYRAALNQYFNAETAEQLRAAGDLDKFLKYQAMALVHGTNHGRSFWNVKYYFDEAMGRIEPVPWDMIIVERDPAQTIRAPDRGLGRTESHKLHDRFIFADPELQFERNRYLWSLVHPSASNLISAYDALGERFMGALRGRHPGQSRGFVVGKIAEIRSLFAANAAALAQSLERNELKVSVGPLGPGSTGAGFRLDVTNHAPSPAGVTALRLTGVGAVDPARLTVIEDTNGDGRLSPEDRRFEGLESTSSPDGSAEIRFSDPAPIYSARNQRGGLTFQVKRLFVISSDPIAFPKAARISFLNMITGLPGEDAIARIEPTVEISPPASAKLPSIRRARVPLHPQQPAAAPATRN